MRQGGCVLLVLALLALAPGASLASAQEQVSPAPLDPDKLPISVDRIRSKLAALPPSEDALGLQLRYYIEVYGRAVPLELFAGVDLRMGPVPYGAPTHAELIRFVTPQEFRAPAADLLAPARLLANWLAGKSRDSGSSRTR
jgi:hypothetical protein